MLPNLEKVMVTLGHRLQSVVHELLSIVFEFKNGLNLTDNVIIQEQLVHPGILRLLNFDPSQRFIIWIYPYPENRAFHVSYLKESQNTSMRKILLLIICQLEALGSILPLNPVQLLSYLPRGDTGALSYEAARE